MGRDLSRGKITVSHLEEEMNTEFEMSVVSNFLVSRSSPVRHQKPVKHFCGPCFGPLNPPSCSSHRGHFLRLQKSHPKQKQWRRRRKKIVPTFTECLRLMRTKLKPPANREVFCIKNILPFCPLQLICIGHNFKWAPPAEAVFSHFRSSHRKKFRRLETRKTSFNFHWKCFFNAEQNEAASEPRSFYFINILSCRQDWNPTSQ